MFEGLTKAVRKQERFETLTELFNKTQVLYEQETSLEAQRAFTDVQRIINKMMVGAIL